MYKFAIALLAVLGTFCASAQPQKNVKLRKPDSVELKKAMQEHIKDMHREKGLHKSKQLIPIDNTQKKTTAANQRVSSNSSTVIEAEVSIAYDPNDSNNIVLSYIEEAGGMQCPVYYSSNGGQSWTRSSFNTMSILSQDYSGGFLQGGGDPVFAWDKNGKLYMAWIYSVINSSFDTSYFNLYWAYSNNKGKTWSVESAPNRFIGRGAMDPNSQQLFGNVYEGITDREWLAVDNSGGPNQGNLYCSFLYEPSSGNMNLFGTGVKTKQANNNSFDSTVLVYNGETQFANVQVDGQGKVHVAFSDLFNGAVVYASSTDAGASFSSPVVVGSGVNMFGQTGFLHDRENAATNLAIASDGSLHCVWSQYDNAPVAYYSRSVDGGATWSPQLDMSQTYNLTYTAMPTVAADDGVSISFYGTDGNDSTSYYQVNSSDNGLNLGSLSKISLKPTYFPAYSGNEFFGDYNRSVRAGCSDYSTWCDGRSGMGPKIYFTKTNYCLLGVKEITQVNSDTKFISVYPNPASQVINLEIETNAAQTLSVVISDVTGKTLVKQDIEANAGVQKVPVPLTGIASGNAIISISNADGLVASRQIVINN